MCTKPEPSKIEYMIVQFVALAILILIVYGIQLLTEFATNGG